MFCLISPVAKTPAWFLEGQSNHHHRSVKLVCTSLEMSPASAAKPAVQGSSEEMVNP